MHSILDKSTPSLRDTRIERRNSNNSNKSTRQDSIDEELEIGSNLDVSLFLLSEVK